MPREASITQEQFNRAADAILAAGQRPTNRAVLNALGGGSMSTIANFMRVWKADQERRNEAKDDAIDSEVSRSISHMLARRTQEATADANLKLADLQNDFDTVIAENEHLAGEIAKQFAELENLRALAQSQAGQIEELKLADLRIRTQILEETKARESVQISLARAEIRNESLPTLLADLKEAKTDAKRAGEEAAELRGKFAGLTQKLTSPHP